MRTFRIHGGILALAVLGLSLTRCGQSVKFYTNTFRTDIFVQQYDESAYDFMWVFDNSHTMDDKRLYLQNNLQTFVNILTTRKAINYQMAMVTVDYLTNNGDLVQNGSGLSVVNSKTSANPVQDFASIIGSVAYTPTAFWIQALESLYQATVLHKAQFSRTGVPLVIIFVTDGDDASCASNCFGYEPPHNFLWEPFPMDRYASYFSKLKADEGSETIVFPIVGLTGTSQCAFESDGTRILQFQQMVSPGSPVGSVCLGDIANSYDYIAQTISDRGAVFKLSDQANGSAFSVYVNAQLVPNDPSYYIYDASKNAIVFTGSVPAKGSSIQIIYTQNSGGTGG